MSNIRKQILEAAIKRFGKGPQRDKAIEELSELIRALARSDDRENIAEEMADVRIMLDQLEIIFGNHDRVRQYEMEKLMRLDDWVHAADVIGEDTSSGPAGHLPLQETVKDVAIGNRRYSGKGGRRNAASTGDGKGGRRNAAPTGDGKGGRRNAAPTGDGKGCGA